MPKRVADDSDDEAQTKKIKRDEETPSNSEDVELKEDSEGNLYLDLGSNKRVTVSTFKGRAQMNIREYYIDKSNNQLKPGKKGITLNSDQWSTLVSAIGPLTKQLKSAEGGKSHPSADSGEVASRKKKAEKKESKPKKVDKKPAKKKKKAESSEDEAEQTDDDE